VKPRRGATGAGASRALDPARARAVALDLLSRRGWSRRDLARRLRRRGAAADVAEAVVADLEARGYVDDRAFAAAWAESRARGRAVGSRRLRHELRARGIDRPLVADAVRAAFAETDEEARALAAAARRLPALRGGAPEAIARRLAGYLARRGYPADVVARVVWRTCGIAMTED
jgi:regulatory protein